jgi:cytochrome c-type biogenesis protein CcmH
MTWLVAILLALAAFAVIVRLFKQPRASWTIVLAALTFGLAGYATQASPDIAAAPKQSVRAKSEEGRQYVELRKEIVGEDARSRSPYILMADEWVRRGRYDGAATVLRGVVTDNPRDGDAWLALGIALYLHADRQFTPASLEAYRQAERAMPDNAGPAFFLGVGLLRQRQYIETHRLWSERVASMPEGAPGREALAQRLGALEEMLRQLVANAGKTEE